MLRYQIVRYGLVGVFSVSVDFLVLNILYLGMGISLFWSVLLGFVTSVIVGYVLHSRWTFQYNTIGKEISTSIRYFFATLGALGITEGIVFVVTEKFGIYYNLSKAIALFFAILFTYTASKCWIFQKKVSHNDMQVLL